MLFEERLGGEERRLMHLVPAPAVRLMKRRVLSRPGVNSLMSSLAWAAVVNTMKRCQFPMLIRRKKER